MQHRCNVAAEEMGLEWTCINNDSFTVLVSGGCRCCWVSMYTVWLLHSKWLSKKIWASRATNLINFCIELEHSSVETIWMIQKAFGDDAVSAAQMKVAQTLQRWSGICWKPSTFWKACNKHNAWECWTCTGCNQQRWATMWEPETDLEIPKTTVSEILMHDLGMKCAMANFVLWLLLPEQKEYCVAVANDLIQTATNEPDLLKKVIPLKGTKASLSYVSCFLYLVSSSINFSTFRIMWTDLV